MTCVKYQKINYMTLMHGFVNIVISMNERALASLVLRSVTDRHFQLTLRTQRPEINLLSLTAHSTKHGRWPRMSPFT